MMEDSKVDGESSLADELSPNQTMNPPSRRGSMSKMSRRGSRAELAQAKSLKKEGKTALTTQSTQGKVASVVVQSFASEGSTDSNPINIKDLRLDVDNLPKVQI